MVARLVHRPALDPRHGAVAMHKVLGALLCRVLNMNVGSGENCFRAGRATRPRVVPEREWTKATSVVIDLFRPLHIFRVFRGLASAVAETAAETLAIVIANVPVQS